MIFGSAKDDGFLHSVGAFQIFRNLPGNLINAVLENDGVIVIPVVVNAVFNDIAENIGLSLVWSPAVSDVGCDIDDLKWGKETVLNALLQAVNINRLSKVVDIGYLFAFLRSGGHSDLGCRSKILQNLTPVAIFLGTSSVTLIYHDKVKVFWRNLPEMLLIILSHHLMVESEVHFMRSNLVQAVFIGEIYLIDGLFERGEVLQNTLVNQNV